MSNVTGPRSLGVEMALSADEIRLLNEIAWRTAAEDPAYTRRLLSYDGGESCRRCRKALRAARRAGSRSASGNGGQGFVLRLLRRRGPSLWSLGLLIPVALIGIFLLLVAGAASAVALFSAAFVSAG
jgi:hypothetical protein